ncbi:(2S)-methylsuccinyl-CoA dehydrogenase [Methylobacterium cerastii]|uniref:(2S)-methylsuccinyl-CoA dehydrogenase n=1 Tax=Methylobacterium cerastii TaxID=932741 RepID=A0ABQ4QI26_9HYPH|nr:MULTISPECIES: acyl-CoA dehydrogenase family protein [Methylobacterium]TXM64870.1 acyl-CoA dehydrogenase [Methylobacterium sp. WL120]TXM75993.1 acyl-CoA dehydrogenase [Methylobacterium sp. WL12]TXM93313.1 acyl-CoA dehydrogenase [Methylobacterium sp. WL103]GJD44525.1 (2S)-methylsuccinyl-CoA dehydrogenase [Methylobacterium cerastii]
MSASPAFQPEPQDLVALTKAAGESAKRLVAEATRRVRTRVLGTDGKVDAAKLEAEQHAAHGLAWIATYGEAVRELGTYAANLREAGRLGETETLLVKIGAGEYLEQMFSGIPMSQGEMVRPVGSLGLTAREVQQFRTDAVEALIADGNTPENRAALVQKIRDGAASATVGDSGLDEDMEAIRSEMRRFGKAEVVAQAHEWHLKNDYIPMEIVAKMAELGVFGLTIPEEYGGMGLPKISMCVVSEELSRAYIGVGSLGTRSEIAAELILCGGTEEQKQRFLPKIASGDILPTAVFTEPNTGSDLASLRTKAVKDGETWKISGNKTWITHPVRADIMTVLVRTKPEEKGHRGLSMLIAEKPRGTDAEPFPVEGLTGGEIEVLGYRGMKEYELAFENFEVPAANLLGEVEGKGFAQLMQTFESARIQTAARAVGVAQSALDLGLRYAEDRVQFGKPLISFPRVADKLAMMAVEINIARQLTYFSAREKDEGKRCDLEAGMAKLLGARVAWAAADNALQIHGGNGFALEYAVSRVLCDARILSIFEGAAEIQAQVIARRLLEAA